MQVKICKTVICLFIFITSCLDGYNTIDKIKISETNANNILFYYNEKEEDTLNPNEYIGILTIKDINLNRGFYPTTSEYNDLSKNILYLSESIPPDEKNSMLILAAHRGNSSVSFFNDLDKLKKGAVINLSYKKKDYTYILEYKYDELKDGRLNIYRDKNKDSLILITCNKKRQKYQTIYVAYRRVS